METRRFAKPVAWDRRARSPLEYSVGVGPAKIRSITPVAGVIGCTGRTTGVKKGSVLARYRFWLKSHTLLNTAGKAALMSMTTRSGLRSVKTLNGSFLASPTP